MEGKEINVKKTFNLVEAILNTDEYYSIEDYGQLLTVQTCLSIIKGEDILLNSKKILNKNDIMTKTVIKANFQVDGRLKEVYMEKKKLNKIYSIYKIYSKNNKFIKILINRFENYEADEMLTKINNLAFFKGVFKTYFNIDEFPIKSYNLEEKKVEKKNNEADEIEKEFILMIKNNSNNLLDKKNEKISIKNESEIDDIINTDNKNEIKEFPESKIINNGIAINSEIKLEINKMNSILFQDDNIINEVHNHKGGNESIDEFHNLSENLKYSNCRIVLDENNDKYGTGFISKIFLSENEYIKVLFTCNHVINQEYISSHDVIILEFTKNIKITLRNLKGRRKWTNPKIDYTCIEILDIDLIYNYLDIDKNILSSIFNENYINEGIIIFGIMKKNNKYYQGFDFGLILKYINNKFYSNYNSDPGSSGGAIILKKNHKIIGIHKGGKYSSKFGMKVNGIIPINIILEDMKINLKIQKTKINEDLPSSIHKSLSENDHEPIERFHDLTKDITFYPKCKNCGNKYGNKEFSIRSYNKAVELDKNFSIFDPCRNCGKTGHELVIPYIFDVKCLECGDIIIPKIFFCISNLVFLVKIIKDFTPCEKCGKQNYTIDLRRDEDL